MKKTLFTIFAAIFAIALVAAGIALIAFNGNAFAGAVIAFTDGDFTQLGARVGQIWHGIFASLALCTLMFACRKIFGDRDV